MRRGGEGREERKGEQRGRGVRGNKEGRGDGRVRGNFN